MHCQRFQWASTILALGGENDVLDTSNIWYDEKKERRETKQEDVGRRDKKVQRC